MYYIVYVSAAAKPFTSEELKKLLDQSREGNLRTGITGLLLYSEGAFMQAIEGNEDAVKQLFRKIEADKRHTCIIKTSSGKSKRRVFANWAMAFEIVPGHEFAKAEAFLNPHDISFDPNDRREPMVMLRGFLESRKP